MTVENVGTGQQEIGGNPNSRINILIVSGDPARKFNAGAALIVQVKNVKMANDQERALELLEKNDVNVLLVDLQDPEKVGDELITQAKRKYPNLIIIATPVMEGSAEANRFGFNPPDFCLGEIFMIGKVKAILGQIEERLGETTSENVN